MCTHSSEEMNPKENEWFDKMEELLKTAPDETTYIVISKSGSDSCKGRGIITLHGKTPELVSALTLSYEKAPDIKTLVEQSVEFANYRKRAPLSDFIRRG